MLRKVKYLPLDCIVHEVKDTLFFTLQWNPYAKAAYSRHSIIGITEPIIPVILAQGSGIPIAEAIFFFMDLEIISKAGPAKMMY